MFQTTFSLQKSTVQAPCCRPPPWSSAPSSSTAKAELPECLSQCSSSSQPCLAHQLPDLSQMTIPPLLSTGLLPELILLSSAHGRSFHQLHHAADHSHGHAGPMKPSTVPPECPSKPSTVPDSSQPIYSKASRRRCRHQLQACCPCWCCMPPSSTSPNHASFPKAIFLSTVISPPSMRPQAFSARLLTETGSMLVPILPVAPEASPLLHHPLFSRASIPALPMARTIFSFLCPCHPKASHQEDQSMNLSPCRPPSSPNRAALFKCLPVL